MNRWNRSEGATRPGKQGAVATRHSSRNNLADMILLRYSLLRGRVESCSVHRSFTAWKSRPEQPFRPASWVTRITSEFVEVR
jgi:hypothetical protein